MSWTYDIEKLSTLELELGLSCCGVVVFLLSCSGALDAKFTLVSGLAD